jgi:hypothetical protein
MKERKEATWYEQIFDALVAVNDGGEVVLDPDREPEWVQNVLKQIMQQVMPAMSLKPHDMTPRRLGRLIGQQQANWAAAEKAIVPYLTPENLAKGEALIEQLEKMASNPVVWSLLQAFEFAGDALVSFGSLDEKYEKIMLKALVTAWRQPDQLERLAFFQGIAEGLLKPGIPSRFTDATPIYHRLLVHRELVKGLKSVRELRDFLLRYGLSQQQLGDPKRLEKLCERIGLSFGGRGRPKRTR